MSECRVIDLKELGVSREIFDKIYSMGNEDGRADGAREFAEWLLINHTLDCIECNHGDKTIGCKECANEYITEWQKEAENV